MGNAVEESGRSLFKERFRSPPEGTEENYGDPQLGSTFKQIIAPVRMRGLSSKCPMHIHDVLLIVSEQPRAHPKCAPSNSVTHGLWRRNSIFPFFVVQ